MNGTSITYEIEGNPRSDAQPDSLFVNAYMTQWQPATVLRTGPSSSLTSNGNNMVTNNKSSLPYAYQINLPKGKYIRLSTATWIADEKKPTVNGYVIYGQRIQVN